MSTNSPAPRGFIVTDPIAPAIPAAVFQEGDAFALPEAPDNHLITQSIKPCPDLPGRLAIHPVGRTAPFTIRADELLLPLRMLRPFDLTCHRCSRTVHRVIDLVLHGTPQLWICGQCS
ncbi:hypothetical protein [Streptomyces sp. NPDC058672]|uniref:hypothetical protein n=1 Tax=Streptomyces sp. NPDC058672 TaxID=3346591 RepID=UPI00365F29B2